MAAHSIIESLHCPICFELAENAVETSCCHHIFCENCLGMVPRHSCPQCRQSFEMVISHVTRRMIGNIEVECKFDGCSVKVGISELGTHMSKCPRRQFTCPDILCNFQGIKTDFAAHLAVQHEDILVQNADRVFEPLQEIKMIEDRISTRINEAGRQSRLGASGKYYCAGILNNREYSCGCCNGRCGPSNGCNCGPCMKLDVSLRRLPESWYVNREGAASRRGPETGKCYCGRYIRERTRLWDGYCGPTNGQNCDACGILHLQIGSRYSNVWNN